MNVACPILDVVPGSRGHVLHALSVAGGPLSGREVARRAEVPPSSAALILADLVEAGIVTQVSSAHAHGYQLNSKHVLVRQIVAMAQTRIELVGYLREEIARWHIQPVAAWLYGSAARGDGDRRSDIDLLFVLRDGLTDDERDRWEEHQIARLQVDLNDRTGNAVSYLPHSIDTFLALEARRSAFTANLHTDGIDLLADSSSWRHISQARTRDIA